MGRSNIAKGCLGKVRHETEEEARQHIDYIYDTTGDIMDYYKCQICGGYHLTSKKGKRRK